MPELPEVETVRRTLEHQIINEEIKDIKVYYDKIIENVSKDEFVTKLIGETITKINRYGKYLIFILNNVSRTHGFTHFAIRNAWRKNQKGVA